MSGSGNSFNDFLPPEQPFRMASVFQSLLCCCGTSRRSREDLGGEQNEPLLHDALQEHEQEAVNKLLQFLENRPDSSFFEGEPLRVLRTLSYSDHVELQKSAALAFAEVTERHATDVGRAVLEPIIKLLDSPDVEVQRAASAALGNLAVNQPNKLLITKLHALEHLIRQMSSPNLEVQCNAVGCITNLATHPENKKRIAQSGAFVPLIRLSRSEDLRVQRNATGALLNMTHSEENRQQLVHAGAIPVLVHLLNASDADVQYYCTTSLSNIAVDAAHRKRLAQEPKLVEMLIALMGAGSLKIQCQAALALRNLASDERYQLSIVSHGGLPPLLALLSSPSEPLLLASVACVRNISIHHLNESAILGAGFLGPLLDILLHENEEIQCHAISTVRNIAAGMEEEANRERIVEAGGVSRMLEVMKRKCGIQLPPAGSAPADQGAPAANPSIRREVSALGWQVLSEMTAAIAVLALSDNLKPKLLQMNILPILLPLVDAPVMEVQGNAAAAIGNLITSLENAGCLLRPAYLLPQLMGQLRRFLGSEDAMFEHIALWTLLQLVSNETARSMDEELWAGTPELLEALLARREASVGSAAEAVDGRPPSALGSPLSPGRETESEIVQLCRRVMASLAESPGKKAAAAAALASGDADSTHSL